jgi:hypothetical protein
MNNQENTDEILSKRLLASLISTDSDSDRLKTFLSHNELNGYQIVKKSPIPYFSDIGYMHPEKRNVCLSKIKKPLRGLIEHFYVNAAEKSIHPLLDSYLKSIMAPELSNVFGTYPIVLINNSPYKDFLLLGTEQFDTFITLMSLHTLILNIPRIIDSKLQLLLRKAFGKHTHEFAIKSYFLHLKEKNSFQVDLLYPLSQWKGDAKHFKTLTRQFGLLCLTHLFAETDKDVTTILLSKFNESDTKIMNTLMNKRVRHEKTLKTLKNVFESVLEYSKRMQNQIVTN